MTCIHERGFGVDVSVDLWNIYIFHECIQSCVEQI